MSINKAIEAIEQFHGGSLTKNLAKIEDEIIGSNATDSLAYCSGKGINDHLITSALAVKKASAQIDVIIHAAGIMHALKDLLQEGELVESVSLGAGNTGRKFDLETNLQVAEFKFIDWKGGAESIRQNGIFKDFYELAEYDTHKAKNLYVIGTHYPLKFFNGGRALSSVLSKQPVMLDNIIEKYGSNINVVSEYYELHKDKVAVVDVSSYIGRLL